MRITEFIITHNKEYQFKIAAMCLHSSCPLAQQQTNAAKKRHTTTTIIQLVSSEFLFTEAVETGAASLCERESSSKTKA